jgi:hypothetical protein
MGVLYIFDRIGGVRKLECQASVSAKENSREPQGIMAS